MTLSFSAGNQRVYDMSANQTLALGAMRWEGDTAAALSLTAPATGPTDVTVDYTIDDSPG